MNAVHTTDKRGAYILLTLGMLCFGGTWVAGALAVEAIPPATVAVVRFALAALLLWVWDRARGQRRRPLGRRDLPLIVTLGATAVAGWAGAAGTVDGADPPGGHASVGTGGR
ncbi:MAG: EamA family transporter [bacterium]